MQRRADWGADGRVLAPDPAGTLEEVGEGESDPCGANGVLVWVFGNPLRGGRLHSWRLLRGWDPERTAERRLRLNSDATRQA